MQEKLWPLVLYGVLVIGLAAAIVVTSYLLGPRPRNRLPADPYEAGMPPTGTAHIRFTAGFYLVALSFLIFDLEAAFIFAWAVAAREAGWPGYIGLASFVAALAMLLFYEWRTGVLNWGAPRRSPESKRE